MHTSISVAGLLGLVFLVSHTYGHILECYDCTSMKSNPNQTLAESMDDPCFEPVKRKANITLCPHGTSCYKQKTVLYTLREGDNALSKGYVSVSRFCGTERFLDSCRVTVGADSESTVCACTSDQCNTAPIATSRFLLFSSLPLVVVASILA